MTSPQLLRRAVFYVPASSPRMVQKSLTYETDNVTYDLEDSVVDGKKSEARRALAQHLGSLRREGRSHPREIAVRTNPLTTPHGMQDILKITKLPSVDAILLPKVDHAETVQAVAEVIASCDGERRLVWEAGRQQQQHENPDDNCNYYYRPLTLMALIESARAVEYLGDICRAGAGSISKNGDVRPGTLSGIVFGAEDLARDLSAERTPSLAEFMYARSRMVTAARAHGVPGVVDLVCTQLDRQPTTPNSGAGVTTTTTTKTSKLEDECENGRSMGFNGKQVIHPSQLETVHRVFGVPREAAAWAVRVVPDAK
ncbi:citrate lyase subunit beta [Magnaporthiopsis poae ATCC 64411]|uniref:Citrate lyase subunit beta n=1 Tax=Magnaporthiopsis poae (strain ATCC 64411 / 73-15) TaxID=644358 RepID=A0A0C4E231_MAGP6|nr:citrate lyase subunit beta [Magnaporthiopsis poae ATCC 64411]